MAQSKNETNDVFSHLFILDQTYEFLFMLSFLLKQLNSYFVVCPTEMK